MSPYFAYGSNMSAAVMARCPSARALGVAKLSGWRFAINPDGYATVVPSPGATVLGVLWRIGPRDRAALDAYEGIAFGLYRRVTLPVRYGGRRVPALVYIARREGQGIARPGYIDLVVEAARHWQLPEPYIRALERHAPSRLIGARAREPGELR